VFEVKRLFRTLGVVAALAGAAGALAAAQSKPETPKTSPENPAVVSAPGTPKAGADAPGLAVDPNKYVIGPEDVLYIRVWREPDFTLPVVVRPDGKITMPLIGEVEASTLTPQQLTGSLKEQLSKYINNPDVTVFVQEVRSKKYYLDGEINHPGYFPLVTPTTVLEALSNASGFREFANQKDIRILRGSKILHFNYKEVTKGKHLEQNIYLENGDHIIVR
jgi:polysaccharide export outer membrane protein